MTVRDKKPGGANTGQMIPQPLQPLFILMGVLLAAEGIIFVLSFTVYDAAWPLLLTRLPALYGLVLAKRARAATTGTWINDFAAPFSGLFWAWLVPVLAVIAMITATLMLGWLLVMYSEENVTLLYRVVSGVFLMSIFPTWLWCLVRTILLAYGLRPTAAREVDSFGDLVNEGEAGFERENTAGEGQLRRD